MVEVESIRLPCLYPKQERVFFDPARIVACEASTKAGKTVGCIVWILTQAQGKAATSHVWVAPIFPQAEMAFERVCRMFARMDPEHLTGWTCNKSKLWFQTPNGSRIWFKGGDNPDSIYGYDYTSAVIDEATRCPEGVWNAIVTTTTATKGPIRVIGNVKGRHNWAYRLARKAEGGARNMAYYKLIAADAIEAGVLTEEAVQDAQDTLPEQVFRELYLAEPSDDGGNPFGLQHISACAGKHPDGSGVQAFGVDLAKSVDWTVCIGLDEGGNVAAFDRWQRVPWSETQRRILETVGNTPTLIDSTGVGDPIVEGLQGLASNVTGYHFTSKSKQQLMEGLAVAIQRHEIGFPNGQIRTELEQFEYEYTATGVRYSAPEGLHDDCVMALALAVEQKRTAQGYSVGVVHGSVGVPPTYDADESMRLRRQYVDDFVMGRDLEP